MIPCRPTLARSAALLLLALLAPAPARAELPPDAVARNDASYAAADRLFQQSPGNLLPRLSDGSARPVLDRLWDVAVLGTPPYRGADVPGLLDIFDKQRKVLGLYAARIAAPNAQTSGERNADLYETEVCRAFGLAFPTMAALVQAVGAFWDTLPGADRTAVRRQGLHQTQTGIVQMMTGMSIMARGPNMQPANRTLLASTLGRYGPAVSAVLQLDQRAAAAQAIQTGMNALDADDRARLQPLLTALSDTACQGLCRVE